MSASVSSSAIFVAPVFHSGGDDGFITLLILFPEKKTAVVWMVNCDSSAGLSGIHDAAVAAALN
jgi:hypothetical protein